MYVNVYDVLNSVYFFFLFFFSLQFGRQNAITSTTSSERTLDEGVDEIEPGNHDDPLSLLEASPHIDSDDQKEIGRNRRARLLAEMRKNFSFSRTLLCVILQPT